jgi:hypothetical protein
VLAAMSKEYPTKIRRRAEKLGIKLPSRQRFGFPRRLVELGLKVKAK